MAEQEDLQRLADQTGFSGVAVIDHRGERVAEVATGLADRAHRIPMTLHTRLACASATKGFTALTVASLIESDHLSYDTPLATVAGASLSSIDQAVTIEQLLGHTSGVGDYLDEETLGDIDDHVLGGLSAHQLERPHHYLPLLNHYPQVSAPGSTFAYNNSGYVMLSLACERAAGRPFHRLVQERVFEPAGMTASAFLRSDELPGDAAVGYLENGRTNVFHLPVIGAGDGGAYTTAPDLSSFWGALFGGAIVSPDTVEKLTTPLQTLPTGIRHYGLGFWVAEGHHAVMLEGMDAGVSFRSAYHPPSARGFTVISNTSSGVWPLVSHLMEDLEAAIETDG